MRTLSVAFLASTAFLFGLCSAQAETLMTAFESIKTNRLQNHINTLAADTFEGREAGRRGGHAAGAYIVHELKKTNAKPAGEDGTFHQLFGKDYRNILAIIPGSDPVLKNEYIVIGAHYDHVGRGSMKNSRGTIGLIHNGADDNASGTAGLLEVIRAFSMMQTPPKRSLLFAFWDAEEKGLLGSVHWVKNPTVPLESIQLMINIDMIGRLGEKGLMVYGTRSAPGLRRSISLSNQSTDLKIEFHWEIKRNSDHYPFFDKRIPFIMLHTGLHKDYHRHSDDAELVNSEGVEKVSRMAFEFVNRAANHPSDFAFRANAKKEGEAFRKNFLKKPAAVQGRLGINWQWDSQMRKTVIVETVEKDSPAQKAGLKVGDHILEFGGHQVSHYSDFRTVVLGSPKNTSAVVIRKGGNTPETLNLQLIGDPVRVGIWFQWDEAEPNSIILSHVAPGSVADLAGLQTNDRIYQISGRTFRSHDEFARLAHRAFGRTTVEFERNGRVQRTTMMLSRR